MKPYDEGIELVISLAEDEVYEGNYERARSMLDGLLYEEPGYPKIHETLAWMYHFYKNNEELATRHYELVIYFDPENEDAYDSLTDLLISKKKFDKVDELMDRALKSEKIEKSFIYENKGKIRERNGQFKEAIAFYRKALLSCMNNDDMKDYRQNIRRCRFKQLRTHKILGL